MDIPKTQTKLLKTLKNMQKLKFTKMDETNSTEEIDKHMWPNLGEKS